MTFLAYKCVDKQLKQLTLLNGDNRLVYGIK